MSSCTRLSCLWFADNERTTCTAVITLGGGLGSTIGYLLGPWVVKTADDVPKLLYITLAISSFIFVCMLIRLKDHPEIPPSATAASFYS